MERFMGLMPMKEIKVNARYETPDGDIISIQAGPNGWTIVYPDNSTDYSDTTAKSTDDNLKIAKDILLRQYGTLEIVPNGLLDIKYNFSDFLDNDLTHYEAGILRTVVLELQKRGVNITTEADILHETIRLANITLQHFPTMIQPNKTVEYEIGMDYHVEGQIIDTIKQFIKGVYNK